LLRRALPFVTGTGCGFFGEARRPVPPRESARGRKKVGEAGHFSAFHSAPTAAFSRSFASASHVVPGCSLASRASNFSPALWCFSPAASPILSRAVSRQALSVSSAGGNSLRNVPRALP